MNSSSKILNRRARAGALFMIAGAFVTAMALLRIASEGIRSKSIYPLLAFGIILLLSNSVLRKTNRFREICSVLFLTAHGLVVLRTLKTGGLTSPTSYWLLVLIVFTTVCLGPTIGAMSLLVTIAAVSIMLFGGLNQFINTSYPPSDQVYLVVYSAAAGVMYALICVYERAILKAEKQINERNRELAAEKEKSEKLLQMILPKSVVEELKNNGKVTAKQHENISVLFADLKGFTEMCNRLPVDQVIGVLNELFSRFDVITNKHGLYRLKTIGDCYMCAGSVPERQEAPFEAAVLAAQEMIDSVKEFNLKHSQEEQLTIRIGISSGPAISGVLGVDRFAYDIWGQTVNLAARLESHGEDNLISICSEHVSRLPVSYHIVSSKTVYLKGFGDYSISSVAQSA